MKIRKGLFAVLAVSVLSISSLAAESVTVRSTPIKPMVVRMTPQQPTSKVSGTVSLLVDSRKKTGTLTVEVKGLDPGKLYTAWLVSVPKISQQPCTVTSCSVECDGKPVGNDQHQPYYVNAESTITTGMEAIMGSINGLAVNAKGNAKVSHVLRDPADVAKWKEVKITEIPDKDVKKIGERIPVITADLTEFSPSPAVTSGTVQMKAAKPSTKTTGSATINADPQKGTCTLTVQAAGLDPKKTYSAWLNVVYDRKTDVSRDDSDQIDGNGVTITTSEVKLTSKSTRIEQLVNTSSPLKVDAQGNASVTYSNGNLDDVKYWKEVLITEQPSGDWIDVDKRTVVLSGDLTKIGSR